MSTPKCAENDWSVILVGAVIVSDWVEVLFEEIGSLWSAETVAVLETTLDAPGRVKIEIVAVPAFAIVPSRQVTTPFASEQEPDGVAAADRYVTTEGSVSVTVTFVADAGPLFVIVKV